MDQKLEWQLMLQLCKFALIKDASEPVLAEGHTYNWFVLLKHAQRHRVHPLLYKGIVKWSKKTIVPSSILAELKSKSLKVLGMNMDHAKELVNIVRTFQKKGVEVIPYKGTILALEAFEDVGAREMSDIDFLMKVEDFPIIKAYFLSRGFVPTKVVPDYFESRFFEQNFEYNFDLFDGDQRLYHVEPHWQTGSKRLQTHMNFHDIKPLTATKKVLGVEMNVLTPEGLLISTCLHHGGGDRWNTLKSVADIAAILHRFQHELDWNLLFQHTKRMRVTNIVLLGIQMAITLFRLPVMDLPVIVREKLKQRTIQYHATLLHTKLSLGTYTRNIKSFLNSLYFHFSLRSHPITKIKVLYYHIIQIFIPTIYDVNDMKVGRKNHWKLYLTKPFRIWNLHVRK